MLFSPLYRTLYSDANLNRAWRAVRRQSKSAGMDGMSTAQFMAKSFVYLKALQRELHNRKYVPGLVKRIYLQRDVGPPRELGIPSVKDRIVYRALAQVLLPEFEPWFDDYSHAYRTGRSPKTAIAQARQHAGTSRPWMAKIDLRDCFGTIPHKALRRCVRQRVRDFAINRLLKQILDADIITESRSGSQVVSKQKGLLQGSPLSPLLANIYLDRFDKAARQREMRFVRYGDDIVIFETNRQQAEHALDAAVQILEKMKLELNKQKTRLFHLGRGCNYLGEWFKIEGSPTRDESSTRRAKEEWQ